MNIEKVAIGVGSPSITDRDGGFYFLARHNYLATIDSRYGGFPYSVFTSDDETLDHTSFGFEATIGVFERHEDFRAPNHMPCR